MTRGRFDVWAPAARDASGSASATTSCRWRRGDDGWWTPDGPVPDGEVDYGYLLDDSDHAGARPALAAPARTACTSGRARSTPTAYDVDRRRTGPAASSPAR